MDSLPPTQLGNFKVALNALHIIIFNIAENFVLAVLSLSRLKTKYRVFLDGSLLHGNLLVT